MKVLLKFWIPVVLVSLLSYGCGCGGGTQAGLVSLEVTPQNPVIALGTDQQFIATGIFSDGSRQDLTNAVTWSSSEQSVASISNESGSKGLAGSLSPGSTVITAGLGDISGSTTLTVTGAVLVSITVVPANPIIRLGTQQQFSAIGGFADGTTRDITNSVIWSSSDLAIASISNQSGSKGLADSAAVGVTNITAASGNVSGSTSLRVTAISLIAITVTPANVNVAPNTTVQYTATAAFSDGSTRDITAEATWSASEISVATISNQPGSKGLATAVSPGSTTVSAASEGVTGSTLLTVSGPVLVSIKVTPANKTVKFNSKVQYTATGIFSDASTRDITTEVVWSSSDTTIAVISNEPGSKGLATTDGIAGRTTITATLGNVSGSTLLIDP